MKFSPKRNAAFDKIRSSLQEDIPSSVGIRTFCQTRWTVRGNSLESIIVNYTALSQLWDECLEAPVRLETDVKARIIGVKAVMSEFKFLYGLKLADTIFKITDNLSKTLQKTSMSAAEAQHIASLTVATLQGMRSDDAAQSFFGLVSELGERVGVDKAVLPRRHKVPRRLDGGYAAFHAETPEQHYRVTYYEVVDLAISAIQDRFDQPGYAMYRNLEDLLLNACRGHEYHEELQRVCLLYHELDASQLDVQIKNLATHFTDTPSITLHKIIEYFRSLSAATRSFFSEVCKVTELILVMPATNAVSERSFSTMRRIKGYLRSTMKQDRLNHLMTLNIYQEQLDKLDMAAVANEFVCKNEHRSRFFGTFT